MTKIEPAFSKAMADVIVQLKNTLPYSFKEATDLAMSPKQRWTAFDKLFDQIVLGLREKGYELNDVHGPEATPESEQRIRQLAALALMSIAWGGGGVDVMNDALWQVEVLAPTLPNPETGMPQMGCKDQALLHWLTEGCREEFPNEWRDFFMYGTVSIPRRKQCFAAMYNTVFRVWEEESLFPRTLPELEKQKLVMQSVMSWVPRDQWDETHLEMLYEELLPVEIWDIPTPPK